MMMIDVILERNLGNREAPGFLLKHLEEGGFRGDAGPFNIDMVTYAISVEAYKDQEGCGIFASGDVVTLGVRKFTVDDGWAPVTDRFEARMVSQTLLQKVEVETPSTVEFVEGGESIPEAGESGENTVSCNPE